MATNIVPTQGASVVPGGAQVAPRPALQPVSSRQQLGGFGNMLGKELGDWFKTRRWIWQLVIWLAIINGFMAFILWAVPAIDKAAAAQGQQTAPMPAPMEMGLTLLFSFLVQIGTVGVIILSMDEIVGEKQLGTAAWILSKPVSRSAFVLSKLVASIVGIAVFVFAAPSLVGYFEIWLASGTPPDAVNYVLGLVPVALTFLFYLSLTLMLGVLFDARGPVLGIAFGALFGLMLIASFVPQLGYVLPMNMHIISLGLAQGMALPDQALYMLAATFIWPFVFMGVALWRFQKQEL